MSTISLRTIVYDDPGTPLGLLGRSQRVVHFCEKCRSEVPTGELMAHAREHGEPARWWEAAVERADMTSNTDEGSGDGAVRDLRDERQTARPSGAWPASGARARVTIPRPSQRSSERR
jgi:hypothetical protein